MRRLRTWVIATSALSGASMLLMATAASAQLTPAVEQTTARARAMVDGGDGASARTLLDSLVNATPAGTPDLGEALYWRAVLAERIAEAERDWKRLVIDVPLSPRAPDALVRLGELEMLRGRPADARVYFARLLRDFPGGAYRTKGLLWMTRSYFEERNMTGGCSSLDSLRGIELPDGELRLQSDELQRRCAGAGAGAAVVPPSSAPETRTEKRTEKATELPSAARPAGRYSVQLAAYDTRAEAEEAVQRFTKRGLDARIDGERKPFRVRVGYYATRAEAVNALNRVKKSGLDGFVAERAVSGAATPLMQQYREIKSRHQDAILFFRMGDFYEMFYDDAETASRAIGLTLTSRNNGGAAEVPLAGIPVKAAAEYLRRLVGQGFRVAICEQVEDPKLAKGIVKREVVETITPGAVFADDLLDGARANYVCAIATGRDTARDGSRDQIGIAAADLSTGEWRLFLVTPMDAPAVLARLAPRELLVVRGASHPELSAAMQAVDNVLMTEREGWEFDAQLAGDELARQFDVRSLEGFGLGSDDAGAIGAAGALLRYLRELQPGGLPHLARPVVERPGGVMPLDEMTRRNLELVESLRGGELAGTLLSVLDRTTTPMGQRMLRQWLLAPLLERGAIELRLDAVTVLVRDPVGRAGVRDALDGVRDVERLASKAAAGRATPRELRALGDSLARLPQVANAVRAVLAHATQGNSSGGLLTAMLDDWDDGRDCAERLTTMLVERPPLMIGEEDTIAPGIDPDLDALRALRDGGKDAIATIQSQERARTGIHSLKVGYNRVFGYFLEISNANKHLVPDDYQRRQTLTGAERYVTPALKEYEEKVLSAADRIETRERELFEALRRDAGAAIRRWQQVARRVATIDVLTAFAEVAEREQYARPELNDGFDMEIVAGRHPVVERMMAREKFIPNDLVLSEDGQMIVLTGPNMAGKSTILRQVGLIQLMAQVGAYVPARRAKLPIVDRLFTRVGASDNLVRGQSTFMVEMSETSAILHTATKRSLVLLDEIGRGTSTYDGVSIAWSVSEHLHDAIGCKTVFATHYHELTQLASELSGVRNFTVAVREVGDQVLFLHKLIPGGADRSYGIEVGRLAGLPAAVIARAKEVLALLEGEGEQMAARLTADGLAAPKSVARKGPRMKQAGAPTPQLGFFGEAAGAAVAPDPALARLADAVGALEPDQMTPMQALTALASLKQSLSD